VLLTTSVHNFWKRKTLLGGKFDCPGLIHANTFVAGAESECFERRGLLPGLSPPPHPLSGGTISFSLQRLRGDCGGRGGCGKA